MPRALIVNPEQTSRFSARLLLENLGFEVLAVSAGTDALGHLLRGGVDLVLLDAMIDGGDPFGLIGTIAAFGTTRPCVIFTTGTANSAMVNEALEAGADDYLIGAFGRDVLAFKLVQAQSGGFLNTDLPVIDQLRKTA